MKDGIKTLKLKQCVDAFYTGGSVQWCQNGKTIFTVCGSIVKALNVEDGLPCYDIGNADDNSQITCAVLLEEPSFSITLAYANGLICRYTLHSTDSVKKCSTELNRRWKSVHSAPVTVMKYCNDATLLATGAPDFLVKVWNVDNQNCIASLRGPSAVSDIVFVDSLRLIVGYSDGSSSFFDVSSETKLIYTWKLHTSQIVSVLLQDEKEVSFLSRDQTVSTVNLETCKKVKVMPVFEPMECGVLADHELFTVGEEGILKCWTKNGSKLIRSIKISDCRIDEILYNEVQSQFLLVASDFNLYLVSKENFSITRRYVGFNDEIFDTAFIGDEENTLLVAANSPDIRLYDTKTWSCQLIRGHTDNVLSISSAAWDSSMFVSSAKDNSFILWKLVTEGTLFEAKKLAVATGHTNNVTAACFSRMSKRKFILSVSHDCTLKLWSLAKLSEDECVKLSASSTFVAHAKEITCLDISANDRLCVTGSMDKTAKLWHIDSKTMQLGIAGTLPGHRRGVWDVRFCDFSEIVGTCSGDHSVRVFSISSRECIATLVGHSFAVLQMIFVSHGKQIISADSGGLLKIWDLNTKECIKTTEAHYDKIWALVASEDESKFVTGGSDGRIGIWEDVTAKELEEEERLRAKRVSDDQKLSNLMEQKRFSEAFSFTLTLDKPYSCYMVISKLMETDSLELTKCVAALSREQLVTLLDFATKWNTNGRTARVIFL
ncbi:unnamed protein product [Enterobius vermicularis]|uniref:WD_REPEATS_REGION domain-containing protein n=1 Tax=Enterobius vermicularis TaxID=51028 RepID=A0A158QB17_ENTVE|nr:unnamed protein product [Enterobius vermicularis]